MQSPRPRLTLMPKGVRANDDRVAALRPGVPLELRVVRHGVAHVAVHQRPVPGGDDGTVPRHALQETIASQPRFGSGAVVRMSRNPNDSEAMRVSGEPTARIRILSGPLRNPTCQAPRDWTPPDPSCRDSPVRTSPRTLADESVEQGRDDGGVADELPPVLDQSVRREDRGGPLVAAHDQLEQVLGSPSGIVHMPRSAMRRRGRASGRPRGHAAPLHVGLRSSSPG